MMNFPEIDQFLLCKTPKAWVDKALENQDIMLIDHANCEKKAAASALHFMHRYTEHHELLQKMARLAREELLHFQKVSKILKAREIPYVYVSASRYADSLRKKASAHEPKRLVDLLIIGAFIEARSCERFHAVTPFLDEELQKFYTSLYAAEKRHFQDYLMLAEKINGESVDDRVAYFAEIEASLITEPDTEFRFHSGIPISGV